jgi:hypothetical protein
VCLAVLGFFNYLALFLLFIIQKQRMSRTKKAVSGIAALYRSQTIDVMLFAHVRARMRCQASLSIMDAVHDFISDYDLTDDLDLQVAYQIYQRLNTQYRQNKAVL